MIKSLEYSQTSYVRSAVELGQLPPDSGSEVAFIGRSNAGKSSAINAITGIKGLCRTSKTPGRTQAINVFAVERDSRIMDLPGYGYARVPRAVQAKWEKTVDAYLEIRQSLMGLVIVMDIRHPLKEMDQQMITWAVSCGIPIHILLTKADKLKSGEVRKTLKRVQEQLLIYADHVSVQVFSSLQRSGVDEARDKLSEWLQDESA